MALIKQFFYLVLCLALLASSSGFAKDRSLRQVIDDGVITNSLKIKFMKDKKVKANQLDVDTFKGVVSLYGAVDSQAQINRVIEIAEIQQGVKEVKSYLTIKDQVGIFKPDSAVKAPVAGSKNFQNVEERDLSN
jgi:hyperosmotically inducible protein